MFFWGDNMKKAIIIFVFLLLISFTAYTFVKGAIDSYNYDMDPNNGVDLLEGFGAVFILLIGGFVVFYEIDLFYTVYYFLVKQKTVTQTILNILSNFSLALVFVYYNLSNIYMELRAYKMILPILFLTYVGLRVSYLVVSIVFSVDPK